MPTDRILPDCRSGRRCEHRGSAFIECILAMPFLLFIMVLGMNFCKTYLGQQRALVAARYVAWADVQHRPLPTSNEVASKFFFGEAVDVGSRRVASEQSGWFGAAFSQASGTAQYRVTYKYKPIYTGASSVTGKNLGLFPAVRINGTLNVDSGDWRYPDFSFKTLLGDLFNTIKNLF
jgi:hypothetical protein